MLKKYAALLALTALLTGTTVALAQAPTSQFGFEGWPYRQETSCSPTEPAASPTGTPIVPTSPVESEAPGTVRPTFTPESPSEATPAPTRTPQATAVPTKVPSMDEDYTTDGVSTQEQIAWNLLNRDRAANGLPALTLDPKLSAIARRKSEDMRDNNYFAHQSPTYGSASEMLKRFGYSFSSVGENIAHHATVEKSQAAFMSSTGHRRNILSSAWTKVGIGVTYDRNGYVYVTQLFVR